MEEVRGKNPPSVTIVVPVRNRAEVVGRTLRSIEQQTYRPLSVVLVDNGSTDGTAAVLAAWADRVGTSGILATVVSEPAPGACSARNAGLAAVTTEWTMFFDSDDVMLPEHVAAAMAQAAADVDVVGWGFRRIYPDGRTQTHRFYTTDVWYNNAFHSSFSTQKFAARTELLRRAGGWDTACRMFDDAELGMRLLQLNPRLRHMGRNDTVEVYPLADSVTNDAAGRIASMSPAFAGMARSMPPRTRHWAAMAGLVSALTWAKPDPESEEYVREVLRQAPPVRRWLWRLFALYIRLGGRGVSHLYKPFRYI